MSSAAERALTLKPLSAEVLARLYYGLALPTPAQRHDNRCNTGVRMALRAMRRRCAITDDNQVTDLGVALLRRYVERRI